MDDMTLQGRRRRSGRSGRSGHGRTRIHQIPFKLNSLLSRNNESYCLKLNSRTSFWVVPTVLLCVSIGTGYGRKAVPKENGVEDQNTCKEVSLSHIYPLHFVITTSANLAPRLFNLSQVLWHWLFLSDMPVVFVNAERSISWNKVVSIQPWYKWHVLVRLAYRVLYCRGDAKLFLHVSKYLAKT